MIAYASSHIAAAKSVLARLNDAIFFPLITLGIAVAVVVFAWGLFQYVTGEKGAVSHTQGRTQMLYGVIGFVVMLSALTILNIAAHTFGVSTEVNAF